ncbi:MAG: CdaR family transcriptional regulator [Oceanospirillaceae bacterium]|uniref:PucR family transcriptional regulator n=1 Tax=unclassified Thalassolituus TaxID=2624967 RepID=UPI000C5AC4E3|nr:MULTISPECIES: PucR family transcriptional regulator [unclassified Thalassolituus]MAS25093.1 CdaR family transcriptional regulator [Oceanospirillaceae bacterium]MBL36138.1 CdaR family transcriptional regulator [Oceanospirillaceae bacterium]MBS53090.1 CdaR family transcriptional regulator [Oceanospirillaceae bacterium]|tara:strand:+ start:1174 stop:2442 length:1269 start_codon:yes stop_codon:yes gene_type:complete
MSISCADIPRLPGLESIRFRAGLSGGQRIVRWPYVAENDSIRPWVNGGELVFITGINHDRDEGNLRQLIEEAVEREVAGLVILTGPEFIQQIPANVLELANRLEFPLLEQPYELPMVFVTEVISNAIVQDNLIGQSVRLFLTRLINGFAQAPELIHLRASELGISDAKPFATLAIRFADALQPDEDDSKHRLLHLRHELEQQLGDLLKRRGIDWPVLCYEQDMLAIWPVEDTHVGSIREELEQALSWLQKRFPQLELYAGVSDLQPGLIKLADATEQARQALQFAVQHRHQRIFFSEQLGIARLFAAIPKRSLLAEFCQQQLGPLCFARDTSSLELKATLNTWLNHFGHQQNTAEALGIHRNTLSYRLKRIEEILGFSLQDPFQRLNLQNALLIEQILFQHHNIEGQLHEPAAELTSEKSPL